MVLLLLLLMLLLLLLLLIGEGDAGSLGKYGIDIIPREGGTFNVTSSVNSLSHFLAAIWGY